jgi:hypothetical protein
MAALRKASPWTESADGAEFQSKRAPSYTRRTEAHVNRQPARILTVPVRIVPCDPTPQATRIGIQICAVEDKEQERPQKPSP